MKPIRRRRRREIITNRTVSRRRVVHSAAVAAAAAAWHDIWAIPALIRNCRRRRRRRRRKGEERGGAQTRKKCRTAAEKRPAPARSTAEAESASANQPRKEGRKRRVPPSVPHDETAESSSASPEKHYAKRASLQFPNTRMIHSNFPFWIHRAQSTNSRRVHVSQSLRPPALSFSSESNEINLLYPSPSPSPPLLSCLLSIASEEPNVGIKGSDSSE